MEQISIVTDRRSTIGESPHWDSRINKLLYVDLFKGSVIRLDPDTKEETAICLGDSCVSLVVPSDNDPDEIIVSKDKQLCRLHWNSKKVDVCCEVEAGLKTRFNDGKCDAKGRLWAGTMALEISNGVFADDFGNLYTFDRTNNIKQHKGGLKISNGLAWDSSNRIMYFVDSLPGKIYVYDYDGENGTITNERVLADYKKSPAFQGCGFPDGMTIDQDDKLWVACFNGSCVLRIDPQTGAVIRKISFPAQKITSCAFGGPQYNTLYVTSGWFGLDERERAHQPEAGSVFKVTGLEAKGLPPINFAT